ncbi:hypothetical protein KSX_34110 [Ktedonospora formicarum]|uniref:HTH cro/C1-type domain-containing protein n=2 Tax=Ktedonospora formicarum TaxID=2778364 RepID=A0A8J3I1Z7_9CHLR|nr:hypothetical protein KSX_34110 [Ktedonospora formicarum]
MKHLRAVEGELRGYQRPMTQVEVVQAMREELNETLSQAYLSQLESGKRLHLTASSRDLLARFFNVHPGYLVSDPPDFSTDLLTSLDTGDERLNTWLDASATEWRSEPDLHALLQFLASTSNPRAYLALFRKLTALSFEELEAVTEALTTRVDSFNLEDTPAILNNKEVP